MKHFISALFKNTLNIVIVIRVVFKVLLNTTMGKNMRTTTVLWNKDTNYGIVYCELSFKSFGYFQTI